MRGDVGAARALAGREIVRFYRQPNRIVGAALQPLVFWLLLGFGFAGSFRAEGRPGAEDYLRYAYPGILVLTLLFTAVFATISIVEDRREGFLQGVLVAPVSRAAIVLGKVGGAGAIAFAQGLLYLLLAPTAGVPLEPLRFAAAAGLLALLAVALTSLGFAIAWRMDSTQGFHAIMNVFLIPLWLLSGAFFPGDGSPAALRAVMAANPLTYGVAALRRVLHGDFGAAAPGYPALGPGIAVTVATAVVLPLLAILVARRPEGRGRRA